jgi:hypothetical protein
MKDNLKITIARNRIISESGNMLFDIKKVVAKKVSKLDADGLLLFLKKWITYNATFAGAGLELAKNWSYADINSTQFSYLNSRVSPFIMQAVLDEFALGKESSMTHREMAWKMLEAAAYIEGRNIGQIPDLPQEYSEALAKVIFDGYSGDRFFSLGFHFAAERFAADEFTALHDALATHQTEFYDAMTKHTFEDHVDGKPIRRMAISWVTDHMRLEEEHFNFTKGAVTEALNTCESKTFDSSIEKIFAGIKAFTEMQRDFYNEL